MVGGLCLRLEGASRLGPPSHYVLLGEGPQGGEVVLVEHWAY